MESTISIDSDKKVSWSLADQQELALYNMRKEIELSYIYGVKVISANKHRNVMFILAQVYCNKSLKKVMLSLILAGT